MQIIHPCKKCLVRSVCATDCNIVNEYGTMIDDIIDSKIFVWSSISMVSLFLIAIYFVLCHFSSIWWLTTIPVLWTGEYSLLRYNDFDSSLKEETIWQTLSSIVMVLPATLIIMLILLWEQYYDKYRPFMKEAT